MAVDGMRLIARVRLAGALMLVGCLALPLSTCHPLQPVCDTKELPPGMVNPACAHPPPVTQYNYVWNPQGPPAATDHGVSVLAAFTWPLAALILASRARRHWLTRTMYWLQPLAMAWSGFTIVLVGTIMGQPASGFYVAVPGFALTLGAWVTEAVQRCLAWRRAGVDCPPEPTLSPREGRVKRAWIGNPTGTDSSGS